MSRTHNLVMFAFIFLTACHTLEGGVMYGRPLNGLYGKGNSVIPQGEEITVIADQEYFTRAIKDPGLADQLEIGYPV